MTMIVKLKGTNACSSNNKRIIIKKRLHLVLDLDHTLLHSVPAPKMAPEDKEYLLIGSENVEHAHDDLHVTKDWVTKIRPHVRAFLKEANAMFKLSIYTMGGKSYAKRMVKLIDPEGAYFSDDNVYSKEDCLLKKRKELFASQERVTLMVDDTEEVWEGRRRNLVKLEPYVFFRDYKLPHGEKSSCWTDIKSDESEEHGELSRVLSFLRMVHKEFYNSSSVTSYDSRDVAEAASEVRKRLGTNLFTAAGADPVPIRPLKLKIKFGNSVKVITAAC